MVSLDKANRVAAAKQPVSSDAHTIMADTLFLVRIAILVISNCMRTLQQYNIIIMEHLLSFSLSKDRTFGLCEPRHEKN